MAMQDVGIWDMQGAAMRHWPFRGCVHSCGCPRMHALLPLRLSHLFMAPVCTGPGAPAERPLYEGPCVHLVVPQPLQALYTLLVRLWVRRLWGHRD